MSYGNRGRGRGGASNQFHSNRNNDNFHSNPNNLQRNIDQFATQNLVPIEILGWNGASHEECISFISRKCRIAVFNHSVDPTTGILKGYVKNQKEADELVTWSGVKFAGQSLRITKTATKNSFSNQLGSSNSTTNTTIELFTNFLKSRYQPEIKMLNLSLVKQDPTLVQQGMFAEMSTSSKFFPALMKIAKELNLEVDSIDLSNNQLNDITTITTLSQTFPKLKNLSLANNNLSKIKVFDNWKSKLNFLRELILNGNPIVNLTNPQDIINLKLEFMKIFPRLIVLNGEILRNEQTLLTNLSFQFETPQPMFFQDEEIRNLATNFIANYIKLWDANRSDLMILYQAQSQFSIQVDTTHPHLIDTYPNPDFGYYIPLSRNLSRLSNPKQRISRNCIGQEQIFKLFQQLPKSKHDLVEKPQLFSMESYRIPQLNAINIVLHGSFNEIGQPDNLDAINNNQSSGSRRFHSKPKKINLEKRCFDRTMIVIPGPNGSMIVASDLLTIRPFTDPDAWNIAANTMLPSPQADPAKMPGPPQPTVADLPPDLKTKLSPIQQELIVKIVMETKLNLQYGFMLCEQSSWDYQQCIINFRNSAATLPKEAYT